MVVPTITDVQVHSFSMEVASKLYAFSVFVNFCSLKYLKCLSTEAGHLILTSCRDFKKGLSILDFIVVFKKKYFNVYGVLMFVYVYMWLYV